MAKYTYLEMVQFILSSMDSDEVDTITETIESQQVADIIQETYEELLDRRDWEFLKHRPRQLDLPASASNVQLDIPSDVIHVENVWYTDHDTSKFVRIPYMSPQDFMNQHQNLDTTQSDIESAIVANSVTIAVHNDRVPTLWTSFDEKTLIFNAFDSGTETNLTAAFSKILAEVRPTVTQADATVLDMPLRMFSLLLHEAKSTCWLQLKQEANPKSEQIARRQYIKLRELERQTVKDLEIENYGRQRLLRRHIKR